MVVIWKYKFTLVCEHLEGNLKFGLINNNMPINVVH